MDGDTLVVVTVACPDDAVAHELGSALVEARVVACAQTVPIRSVYRWQGAVERDDEVMLVLKSTAARLEAIEAAIRDRHPYEVPEILATEVAWSGAAYEAWLRESVAD